VNSPTTQTRGRRRAPWYATTPRDSHTPPWYVWCGVASLLCFGTVTIAGGTPLTLLLPVVLLVLALAAWKW